MRNAGRWMSWCRWLDELVTGKKRGKVVNLRAGDMIGLEFPKRFELSDEQQREILGILECDGDDDLFPRIEALINDYPSDEKILNDWWKAAETRENKFPLEQSISLIARKKGQ